MFTRMASITLASLALAASNVAMVHAEQYGAATPQNAYVQPSAATHTKAMGELERASQRLREAIQTLAQAAPGPDRNQAMKNANQALVDAQQAMVEFGPPAPRALPRRLPNAQPGTYDAAIVKLKTASDRLYDAVHAMARTPAGDRRDDAINEINKALVNTQEAIAWAADKKFASASAGSATRASVTASAAPHPRSPAEDLQVRLEQAGYDVGRVDGVIGAKTRQALKDFQRAHGIAATGRLDAHTIAQLGMEELAPVGGTASQAGGSVGISQQR